MKSLKLSAIILCLMTPVITNGQINKPSLSPKVVTEQHVGLATVKLEYGQPSKQKRQIFGGLIPYGKLWRTGANSSTKITIDRDVTFAGNKIPSGTYGLYSIPNEKEWTIIINANSTLWGAGSYKKTQDLIRFKVPVIQLQDTIETLTIHFENFNTNGGDLIIAWGSTKIVIPVFVDSDAIIYKEIENKIINTTEVITAQTYFDAAQFYYHKEIKLDTASLWFDKAIELNPNAFWYVYYRAELAYHLKDYKIAKEYAEKCLASAKASVSSDYGYIAKSTLLLEKIN